MKKKRTPKKHRVPSWLRLPKHWGQTWAFQPDSDLSDLEIDDFGSQLTDKQLNDPALEAVFQADMTGNTKKIIKLLKSKVTLTPWGRKVIGDWVDRTTSSDSGRKRPIYIKFTQAQLMLSGAIDRVNSCRRDGMSKTEAIKKIAYDEDIPENTLHWAMRRSKK